MYFIKKREILKSATGIRRMQVFCFLSYDGEGNKIIKVKQQINYDQREMPFVNRGL